MVPIVIGIPIAKNFELNTGIIGINYIMASLYLHAGAFDKAFRHISLAIDIDNDIFSEYSELFPSVLLSRKIVRLLKSNDLI